MKYSDREVSNHEYKDTGGVKKRVAVDVCSSPYSDSEEEAAAAGRSCSESARMRVKSKDVRFKPGQSGPESDCVQYRPGQSGPESDCVQYRPAQSGSESDCVQYRPAQSGSKSDCVQYRPTQSGPESDCVQYRPAQSGLEFTRVSSEKYGFRSALLSVICLLCILIMASSMLCACGGGSDGSSGAPAASESSESGSSESGGSDEGSSGGGFAPSGFNEVSYDESSAEGTDGVLVDTSHSSDGYFAVKCDSDAKIKLEVLKDGSQYVYDVENGKVQIFPFQLGNGSYEINLMENVEGSKYSELYSTSADVQLKDEFQPFIRSNQYAAYSKDSKCVAKASELAGSAGSVNDFITSVYDYVCDNISYDIEKASSVSSGYIPDPDKTMAEGKGICFDYASLAASMLRSQGVPAKIIFGYVKDEGGSDIYHAWNMYYTEESGWVAVEFKVKEDDWNRLDLTFSAGGEGSEFISDNSNYMDVYEF